jgi:nicotinamide mononucleotide transporter
MNELIQTLGLDPEAVVKAIEIFALVTGVPYIILEVLQKNAMWIFGIATGLACAFSFAVQHSWANMGLNIYYVVISVWGFYRWRRDSAILKKNASESKSEDSSVHLDRLSLKTGLCSTLTFMVIAVSLLLLTHSAQGSNVLMDALSTAMCVVAMYWLGRSIPYHWIIWIVADTVLVVMCASQGQYALTVLYAAYVASACFGLFHWLKKGKYIS